MTLTTGERRPGDIPGITRPLQLVRIPADCLACGERIGSARDKWCIETAYTESEIIETITCPKCGASFEIRKMKACPYMEGAPCASGACMAWTPQGCALLRPDRSTPQAIQQLAAFTLAAVTEELHPQLSRIAVALEGARRDPVPQPPPDPTIIESLLSTLLHADSALEDLVEAATRQADEIAALRGERT